MTTHTDLIKRLREDEENCHENAGEAATAIESLEKRVAKEVAANAAYIALANPGTILELCALLEKAESDLKEAGNQLSTIVHLDGTCKRIYTLGVHLNKALAAIKQWKEKT